MKSVEITFRPIEKWTGVEREEYKNSRFRGPEFYRYTLSDLKDELRMLKAQNITVQLNATESNFSNDGSIRSNAKVDGPEVILSFDTANGSYSYPCNTFPHWHHNLRAIALALKALRAVDRYGVTASGEQYKGWLKLPDPKIQAAQFISSYSGQDRDDILENNNIRKQAYIQATKVLHPDILNGSHEKMIELNRCMEILNG